MGRSPLRLVLLLKSRRQLWQRTVMKSFQKTVMKLDAALMAPQWSQKVSWMQQEKLFSALLRCHLVFLQIRIWSRDIFSVDILNVVHTPVAQVPHSNRVKNEK